MNKLEVRTKRRFGPKGRNYVSWILYFPESKTIVCSSRNVIMGYSVETCEEIFQLFDHSEDVGHMIHWERGETFLSCSEDLIICTSVVKGEVLKTIKISKTRSYPRSIRHLLKVGEDELLVLYEQEHIYMKYSTERIISRGGLDRYDHYCTASPPILSKKHPHSFYINSLYEDPEEYFIPHYESELVLIDYKNEFKGNKKFKCDDRAKHFTLIEDDKNNDEVLVIAESRTRQYLHFYDTDTCKCIRKIPYFHYNVSRFVVLQNRYFFIGYSTGDLEIIDSKTGVTLALQKKIFQGYTSGRLVSICFGELRIGGNSLRLYVSSSGRFKKLETGEREPKSICELGILNIDLGNNQTEKDLEERLSFLFENFKYQSAGKIGLVHQEGRKIFCFLPKFLLE